MRIPDNILKIVYFLCIRSGEEFIPIGTAFLVTTTKKKYTFYFLVTAKHIISKLKERNEDHVYVRIKTEDSNRLGYLGLPLEQWKSDLSNTEADVAVHLMTPQDAEGYLAWRLLDSAHFDVTHQSGSVWHTKFGIGSEVIIPGLFVGHPGELEHLPIIRMGSIAATPKEGSSRICVGSQGSRDVIQSLKMQPLTTMLALPWSEGRATRGRDPSAVSRPCAEVG
jgi:hypothetical protein